MKKKNNYFLDLHKEWIRKGTMKWCGLCNNIDNHTEIFSLFEPTYKDKEQLKIDGLSTYAWGSLKGEGIANVYNPFRQNIVLFCHEILNS